MSVTALAATMLARGEDPQELHDGGALMVMRRRRAARRCIHRRTGKARVTANMPVPEMVAPAMALLARHHMVVRPGLTMTSTLRTVGRPMTQMAGQA